jgi:hypothetical protein
LALESVKFTSKNVEERSMWVDNLNKVSSDFSQAQQIKGEKSLNEVELTSFRLQDISKYLMSE